MFVCLIVGIHDGDTITARCGTKTEIIRIAEIDAPELGQPFGKAAKASLSALCYGVNATVRPQATDRYGRTVARVTCASMDASAHQAETGMAWAFTKYLTDQSIKSAEVLAKEKGLGLWADSTPTAPWEWRKTKHYLLINPH